MYMNYVFTIVPLVRVLNKIHGDDLPRAFFSGENIAPTHSLTHPSIVLVLIGTNKKIML